MRSKILLFSILLCSATSAFAATSKAAAPEGVAAVKADASCPTAAASPLEGAIFATSWCEDPCLGDLDCWDICGSGYCGGRCIQWEVCPNQKVCRCLQYP